MMDNRHEKRALCADLVTLEWKHTSGWNHVISAVLEDISPEGACVQTEYPVPLGLRGEVRHGDWVVPFESCYCAYREIGYFVGLKFDTETRWSKNAFTPRHYLDLRNLSGLN